VIHNELWDSSVELLGHCMALYGTFMTADIANSFECGRTVIIGKDEE